MRFTGRARVKTLCFCILFAILLVFCFLIILIEFDKQVSMTLAEAFANEMLSGSRVAPHTSSLCSKAPVHRSLAEAVEAWRYMR